MRGVAVRDDLEQLAAVGIGALGGDLAQESDEVPGVGGAGNHVFRLPEAVPNCKVDRYGFQALRILRHDDSTLLRHECPAFRLLDPNRAFVDVDHGVALDDEAD